MDEIVVVVEQGEDGAYLARAQIEPIFTDARDLMSLRQNVRDAVRCHFDEGVGPRRIRLQFIREEIIAA